jgi:hypothetical protein
MVLTSAMIGWGYCPFDKRTFYHKIILKEITFQYSNIPSFPLRSEAELSSNIYMSEKELFIDIPVASLTGSNSLVSNFPVSFPGNQPVRWEV